MSTRDTRPRAWWWKGDTGLDGTHRIVLPKGGERKRERRERGHTQLAVFNHHNYRERERIFRLYRAKSAGVICPHNWLVIGPLCAVGPSAERVMLMASVSQSGPPGARAHTHRHTSVWHRLIIIRHPSEYSCLSARCVCVDKVCIMTKWIYYHTLARAHTYTTRARIVRNISPTHTHTAPVQVIMLGPEHVDYIIVI